MKTYDINYLAGQMHAQREVLLALARLTTNQDDLLEESQRRLELLKTAMLSEPVPERLLDGIAEVENWLSTATGQT